LVFIGHLFLTGSSGRKLKLFPVLDVILSVFISLAKTPLPVLPALPVKILPVRREGREGVVLENYGLIGLLDRIA